MISTNEWNPVGRFYRPFVADSDYFEESEGLTLIMKIKKEKFPDLPDEPLHIQLPNIDLYDDRAELEEKIKNTMQDFTVKSSAKTGDAELVPGDVIFVKRLLYRHFAVYIGEGKVIHYAPKAPAEEATIHEADMKEFLDGDTKLFVCHFPEKYDGKRTEEKVPLSADSCIPVLRNPGSEFILFIIRRFFQSLDYHLYTPEETIERAKSRIGEHKYNLLLNNCEHFAVWCKTGVSDCKQIDDLLDFLKEPFPGRETFIQTVTW